MKRRLILVFMLVVSLGALGGAAWFFTRPTVAESIADGADHTLQLWGAPTSLPTAPATSATKDQSAPVETVSKEGKTFSVIRIPAMNLKFPIAEGTDDTTLKKAIGHYTQTELPGAIGNFAVAGHVCCESNGQPFKQLKKLHAGDVIYVDTAHATYTYVVVDDTACGASPSIVPMNKVEVINANPCATSRPTRKLMTLQTCTDWNGAPATRRVIVWGELRSVTTR